MQKTIVWFRRDLRLTDHPALRKAVDNGKVLPIFILDTANSRPLGCATKWWLHHSLASLAKSIKDRGAKLHFYEGDPLKIIPELCEKYDISHVYWGRQYFPDTIKRDSQLKADLQNADVEVESFNTSLLREPWEIAPKSGPFYKVFTPFWGACLESFKQETPNLPKSAPSEIDGLTADSADLAKLDLLPTKPNWAKGFTKHWEIGEDAALKRFRAFTEDRIYKYNNQRDLPAVDGTSKLSPHLHFGEISPRQVYHEVADEMGTDKGLDTYMKEIGWREFGYHLIYHIEDFATKPWKEQFENFTWDHDDAAFKRWQQGHTGYPIVDAGMRQLWQTGWMHNRVRMIVASFLIKDLFIHWKEGEEWFWDTLVDADLANNVAGWQWVAGSGADASPYFRVFNPITQGEKFDPKGQYIREFVPELKDLPNDLIHKPWEAKNSDLLLAGIELGKDYPKPMVDHSKARKEALDRYNAIKDK